MRRLSVVFLVPVLVLYSCEALGPLASAALPMAGRLLATAVGNYNPEYGQMVQGLTDALRAERPTKPGVTQAPLSLEVALLRQEDRDGEVLPVAMENGEVLKWRGSAEESDRFKIFYRPNEDCYVYVILVDGTGFVQVLYPSSGSGKVTAANEGRFLPEGDLDLAYAVDEHVGVETVYFVASRERRVDLELALSPFIGMERPDLGEALAVEELGEDFIELGIADRAVGEAQVLVDSLSRPFNTKAFRKVAGKDLVVTRWFDHR